MSEILRRSKSLIKSLHEEMEIPEKGQQHNHADSTFFPQMSYSSEILRNLSLI